MMSCMKLLVTHNLEMTVTLTSRPFGGMAVFSRVEFLPGYPHCQNIDGIETTPIKVMILPHITIIGIHRSPKIQVQQLLASSFN